MEKGGDLMKSINILRPLAVALLILSIPFFAMTLAVGGVDWNLTDFLIMGGLIFGIGLIIEFANKKIKNKNHKIIAIVLVVLVLLITWTHLAVGLFEFLSLAGS